VFRVSIFGGVPTKIIGETQGWIDVSRDGEKISFVRCYYRDDENCSLWLANARDGSQETKLAARQKPFRIGENRISHDGKSLITRDSQPLTSDSESYGTLSLNGAAAKLVATQVMRNILVNHAIMRWGVFVDLRSFFL